MMLLADSVKLIKGVGEERLKTLNRMSIYTVMDLLMYYPRDYIDRSLIAKINELEINEPNTIKAIIASEARVSRAGGLILTKINVKDSTGTVELIWYNQPYLKNHFLKGKEYLFTGKVVVKYGKIQIEAPDHELYNDTCLYTGGRIIPVYTQLDGISQKVMRKLTDTIFKSLSEEIPDYLPENILIKYGLCSRDFALRNIHFPANDECFFSARSRLVFDELLLLQVSLMKIKGYIKKESGIKLSDTNIDGFVSNLPFLLTGAQKKVLNDIIADLTNGNIMNRLIQGDVGSGKTVVALAAALIAAQNGYQTALMAPTEVLAKQHAEYFKDSLKSVGIETALLTGSQKKKERDEFKKKISSGNIKIIIGTHAVISENVYFNNLGLVITDEQHRFGVRQRQSLSEKGNSPHVLVMTATPIPRTLALILYGDMDISCIDELPPGRQKVDTYSVGSSYRSRIYEFIKKEILKGRQAYIICSMIEEGERQSVIAYTEKLKNEIFMEFNVACLHGKMTPDEKQDIMLKFASGRIDVLVSTTVVEVGINVPNATVMLIEDAERFGLSQLHQLRGRVGRGAEKSYCILITDAKNKTAKERMKIMCKTNDGFEISEKDLKIRGQGDFFGTRQHGLPEMKIANLYKDINILKQVQETITEMNKNDTEKIETEALKYFKLPYTEIIL